jgi:hypothetical protein
MAGEDDALAAAFAGNAPGQRAVRVDDIRVALAYKPGQRLYRLDIKGLVLKAVELMDANAKREYAPF